MTYNPGIPNAGDLPSISQPQMLINFTQANTLFANNHYAFDDTTVALRGKHKFSVYVSQAAGPGTAIDENALYCKQYAGFTNLYYRRNSSGPEILMTNNVTPLSAANGYTFLPGGLMLQWGLDHANGGANTTIGFPTAFSAVPYSITTNFTRSSGSTTMRPLDILNAGTPVTAANFTVWNQNGGHDFYWQAIGPL